MITTIKKPLLLNHYSSNVTMDLDYKYQVKLITNQTLRQDFDTQTTKPTDPTKFTFVMFRFQILDPKLTNPSHHLSRSLMEKLFEVQGQRKEYHQVLDRINSNSNNNNEYPFFKFKPISETLKRNMLEKIKEVADEALVKTKNDGGDSNKSHQIGLILTVNGKPTAGDDGRDGGDDDDGVVRREQCVICGDKFEKIKGVMMLSCGCKFLYHNECIWKWLKPHHTCPTCRFDFALSRNLCLSVPTWQWLPWLRKNLN